jgi:hypothetical protein
MKTDKNQLSEIVLYSNITGIYLKIRVGAEAKVNAASHCGSDFSFA